VCGAVVWGRGEELLAAVERHLHDRHHPSIDLLAADATTRTAERGGGTPMLVDVESVSGAP
jgi:hypothetical protein